MIGRLVDASNATLLAQVELDGVSGRCVYKPVAGERPLWDFPRGTLANREVAAYELSVCAGWEMVPPTVLRDGPHGQGSVQWWIEGGQSGGGVVDLVAADAVPAGWLRVLDAETYDGEHVVLAHADDPDLAAMALFDVVTNNADRKVGHVLREPVSGLLRGVDHGLTFNLDPKLRTVLWGWAGRRIPAVRLGELERLGALLQQTRPDGGPDPIAARLTSLLDAAEVQATMSRVQRLLGAGRYPRPGASRYPAIPWPPF